MIVINSRSVISTNSILRQFGIHQRFVKSLVKPIFRYLKIPKLIQQYNQSNMYTGLDFVDYNLRQLKISVDEINTNRDINIPKKGAVVIVANHPTGILDGLTLIHLVGRYRRDVKIVVNYMIGEIKETKTVFDEMCIYVNPFDQSKELKSSHAGLRKVLFALSQKEAVIFFPAGDISSFKWNDPVLKDNPWNATFCKLIGRVDVPVIPVYIANCNSRWFYFVNKLNNKLGLALLFRELFKQRNRKIPIHIGRKQKRSAEQNADDFARLLRMQIDILGSKKIISK